MASENAEIMDAECPDGTCPLKRPSSGDGTDYAISRHKPVRSAAKNGRSRLKRTKLACTRRSNATRKGSSKAASRLATHCPKRRSRKAR